MMMAISAPSLFLVLFVRYKKWRELEGFATELQKQAGAGDVILVHKPF